MPLNNMQHSKTEENLKEIARKINAEKVKKSLNNNNNNININNNEREVILFILIFFVFCFIYYLSFI